MSIALDAISNVDFTRDPRFAAAPGGRGFEQTLGAAGSDASAAASDPRDPRLLQAARDLVGLTLIYPVLKLAQNDPFKSELMHGGQAEEMFQQQLNEQLADRITRRADLPLVDAIYRKFDRSGVDASPRQGVDRHG